MTAEFSGNWSGRRDGVLLLAWMAIRFLPTRARAKLVAFAAVAILCVTVAALRVPTASAATRTLTVTPASSLTDQAVTLTWAGFTPTTPDGLNQVIIMQCTAHPASLTDCFTAQPFPNSANGNEIVNGVTQPDGRGSARFEVRPAQQLPQLDCNQANPCSILAFENQVVPPGTLPTLSAIAPIAFAPSRADCPPVKTFDVRAEGEASGAPVFSDWAASLCKGAKPLVLDYTETSSELGRGSLLHGQVDIGLTSLPATSDEVAAAPKHPAFSYAPVDLTAVAVVFNMNDPMTNQPITDLTLSPRLLAQVIADTNLSGLFQDPEFVALNAHHPWPVNGVSPPLIRAERNADTLITTGWMASNPQARAFLAGHDPHGVMVNSAYKNVPYPTDIFENRALDNSYVPRQGENQVATQMFYGVRPTDAFPQDPGSVGFIGVVDLATARRLGLPTAKLVNAAGKAVAPETANILAGYHAMTRATGDTLTPNFAAGDPAAYPLVKVDHAMVAKPTDPTKQRHVHDLLTWGATTGQTTLPPGYVPLPKELADQTTAVAATLTASPTSTPSGTPPAAPASGAPTPLAVGNATAGDFSASQGAAPLASATDQTSAPPDSAVGSSRTVQLGAAVKPASRSPHGVAAALHAAIAAAGAVFTLPGLLLLGLLAALAVAAQRAWPHVARGQRAAMSKIRSLGGRI
jgi:ABC-type phosphate transport system substrate-binding protein